MAEPRGSPNTSSSTRLPNQVRKSNRTIRLDYHDQPNPIYLPEQVSFLVGSDIVEESGIAPHRAASASLKEEEESNSNSGGDLCEDVISLGSQDTVSDDSSTCGGQDNNKYNTKHHKSLMRSVDSALSILFQNAALPFLLHCSTIRIFSFSTFSVSYPLIQCGGSRGMGRGDKDEARFELRDVQHSRCV